LTVRSVFVLALLSSAARAEASLVVVFDDPLAAMRSLVTAGPSRPWLARDLDGSGCIKGERELFGPAAELPSGQLARDGFAALTALDTVDGADLDFQALALWSDDGDHRCQPNELTAASKRLSSISLSGAGERRRADLTWKSADGVSHSGLVEVSASEPREHAVSVVAAPRPRSHEGLLIDAALVPVAGLLALGGLQRNDGAEAHALVTVAGALGAASLGLLLALITGPKGDSNSPMLFLAALVGLGAGLVVGGVSAGVAGSFEGTPRTVAAVAGVSALLVGATGLTIGFW
jgi:hypothetical protein